MPPVEKEGNVYKYDFQKTGTTHTAIGGELLSKTVPDSTKDIQQQIMDEYLNFINTQDDLSDNNEKMRYNIDMPKFIEKNVNVFLTTIAVTIAALAIVISIAAWTIDKSIDAVNSNVNSKFDAISTKIEAINQRLDYQEKLNSLEIQKDVAIEIKNQKVSK